MKTLMISTALALALGLSTGATALTQNNATLVNAPALEITLQTETSLDNAGEFYQGDFMVGARASMQALSQSDLYTGKGAVEMTIARWVTH